MTTLLDLMQQRGPVKRTSARDGGEFHAPCPKCGGEDRFMFWLDAGNFYCRRCLWTGDSITFLREMEGLSFREAAALVGKPFPPMDKARYARERAVKARLLHQFYAWYHAQLAATCDLFRGLSTEIARAEMAYQATEEEGYWEHYLADLYDARAQVEYDCDLLTYDRYLAKRVVWWEEERDGRPDDQHGD